MSDDQMRDDVNPAFNTNDNCQLFTVDKRIAVHSYEQAELIFQYSYEYSIKVWGILGEKAKQLFSIREAQEFFGDKIAHQKGNWVLSFKSEVPTQSVRVWVDTTTTAAFDKKQALRFETKQAAQDFKKQHELRLFEATLDET